MDAFKYLMQWPLRYIPGYSQNLEKGNTDGTFHAKRRIDQRTGY